MKILKIICSISAVTLFLLTILFGGSSCIGCGFFILLAIILSSIAFGKRAILFAIRFVVVFLIATFLLDLDVPYFRLVYLVGNYVIPIVIAIIWDRYDQAKLVKLNKNK